MHCIKDDSKIVVPPWFAASSQKRPLRVPAHSCAMTGASVAAYAVSSSRCATPRPCSAMPSVPRFHRPRLSATYLNAYSSLHCLFSYSVVIVLSLHGNARFVNCACCTQKLKNSGSDLYKIFDSVQNKEKSRAGPHSSAVELKLVEKPVILLDKQIIRWEGAL